MQVKTLVLAKLSSLPTKEQISEEIDGVVGITVLVGTIVGIGIHFAFH